MEMTNMNHIVIVQRIHSSNQVGELIASSSKKKGGASIADCFIHCILILKHCGVCRNVLSEQRNTDTVQFLEDIHIVDEIAALKQRFYGFGGHVNSFAIHNEAAKFPFCES